MHLFYYQQGLLEAADAGGGPAPVPSLGVDRPGIVPEGGAGRGPVAQLRARLGDLRWRRSAGALRVENEALESQVLQMQADFLALQEDFRAMKEDCGQRIAGLDKGLEAQALATASAERRALCLEDLVRFHEDQRRSIAGSGLALCQRKDEHIRHLNLKLTEYTVDWQHLGAVQRQTEASLSHELRCLQDRHGELRAEGEHRREEKARLAQRLEGLRAEVAGAGAPSPAFPLHVAEIAATNNKLRASLQLLDSRRQRACEDRQWVVEAHWPHMCIWRDELSVREHQLEKITAQLGAANNALHAVQGALAQQRSEHEEVTAEHGSADHGLREGERHCARWRRRCTELRRGETALQEAARGAPDDAVVRCSHRSLPLRDRIDFVRAETRRLVRGSSEALPLAS